MHRLPLLAGVCIIATSRYLRDYRLRLKPDRLRILLTSRDKKDEHLVGPDRIRTIQTRKKDEDI